MIGFGLLIALGLASALDAGATLAVVLASSATAATFSLGRRAFWILPVAVLGVAAVPHGAQIDALLSWRVAGVSIQSSDAWVGVGLLATAVLASTGELRLTPQNRAWTASLGVFFLAVGCATVWGLLSGNTAPHILQDTRPLLGYALGLGGIALGKRSKAVSLLVGAIVLSATGAAVLTMAVSFGLIPGAAFINETGRVAIRNGVLWIVAIPLCLEYALSSHTRSSVRLLAGALLVVNLAGLAWSGARSLWLAVAICLVCQLVIPAGGRVRRERFRALGLVGAALALFLAATLPFLLSAGWLPDPISQRVSTLSNLQSDSSLGTRLANYHRANAVIARSPFFGEGLGSRVTLYGRTGAVYAEAGAYFDNVPQTIMLKTGMLGLAAFALVFAVAAYGVWRAAIRTGDPLMISALVSIPGLAVLMASSAVMAVYAELAVFAVVWGTAYGMLSKGNE